MALSSVITLHSRLADAQQTVAHHIAVLGMAQRCLATRHCPSGLKQRVTLQSTVTGSTIFSNPIGLGARLTRTESL
jgi:hypothetical protein